MPSAQEAEVTPESVWVDRRPISRRTRGIAIVAAAGLVALLVVPLLVDRIFFTREAAIYEFFDALAHRDATAALHQIRAGNTGDEAFLRPEVLRSPDYTPPTHVKIERFNANSVPETVFVSFNIANRRMVTPFGIVRDKGGFFNHWHIDGLLLMRISTPGISEISINGIRVKTDSPTSPGLPRTVEAQAFPGGYTVRLPDNPILQATEQKIYVGADDDNVRLQATIKPSATAEVDNQVRGYLDQCARSADMSPDGCPFSIFVFGTPTNLHWKITKYPQITVELRGEGPYVRTLSEGSATASGTTKDFSTTEHFSESDSFSVEGPVQVIGGSARWSPE